MKWTIQALLSVLVVLFLAALGLNFWSARHKATTTAEVIAFVRGMVAQCGGSSSQSCAPGTRSFVQDVETESDVRVIVLDETFGLVEFVVCAKRSEWRITAVRMGGGTWRTEELRPATPIEGVHCMES